MVQPSGILLLKDLYAGLVWIVGSSRAAGQCSVTQANDTTQATEPRQKCMCVSESTTGLSFSFWTSRVQNRQGTMKLTESSSGVIVEPEELTRTVALGCSVNHRTTHSSQNTQTSRTYGLAQGEMRTEKGRTTILDTLQVGNLSSKSLYVVLGSSPDCTLWKKENLFLSRPS